jgi:hypothetical protein
MLKQGTFENLGRPRSRPQNDDDQRYNPRRFRDLPDMYAKPYDTGRFHRDLCSHSQFHSEKSDRNQDLYRIEANLSGNLLGTPARWQLPLRGGVEILNDWFRDAFLRDLLGGRESFDDNGQAFLIADNCSTHRGGSLTRSVSRLTCGYMGLPRG